MSEKQKNNNPSKDNDHILDSEIEKYKFKLDSATLNIKNDLLKLSDIRGSLISSSTISTKINNLYNTKIDSSYPIVEINKSKLDLISNTNFKFSLPDITSKPISLSSDIKLTTEAKISFPSNEIILEKIKLNSGIIEFEAPKLSSSIKFSDELLFNQNEINLNSAILSIESPKFHLPELKANHKKEDYKVFFKEAKLSIDPTYKLLNGSINHLSLSTDYKLDLNTRFIENTSIGSDLSKFTIKTKNILSDLEWGKIGLSYKLDLLGQTTLKDNFLEFSSNYLNLYSKDQNGIAFSQLPSKVADLTPKEYLNEAYLLRSTYEPNNIDVDKLLLDQLDTNDILLRHLSELNPNLKNLYIGALEVLKSNNADKIRHYSTSLRELFTHILHILSPDRKIKDWSKDKTHFDNNRPTRKARMLYITRNFHSRKFEKFIDSDIKATLEFIDLLQEGTHKIKPIYSEAQLLIMKSKMESTLIYLIEASKFN